MDGHSKFVEMQEDATDYNRSASNSDWYFIFAQRVKTAIIYRTVYMQTGVNVNTSAIKNRLWTTVVLLRNIWNFWTGYTI